MTLDKKAEDVAQVLAAIEALPENERIVGQRIHDIIIAAVPNVLPRTWYNMPAYSNGSKIICFFRGTKKFGERYMTFGFNDSAKLDEGTMWPIYYALTSLTPEIEQEIEALVKKAFS